MVSEKITENQVRIMTFHGEIEGPIFDGPAKCGGATLG